MSVIEEDLLAPRITKRRVIEIILVASLLISLFAFSTYIYALILGSQRRDPNERLEDADEENPILVFIEPPWDLDDIEELLEEFDINITELAQETGLPEDVIEEYLEQVIPEMLDGTIDDLDLTMYGAAIAALIFSEAEVFRVYDYDEINQVNLREDILWKYECFDEFSGDGWHNTMAPEINNDYFTYDDYVDDYSYLDLIKIERPLPSPNIGQNSFVIGTLFRQDDPTTPFIIKESIDAPNLEEDEVILYNDELGGNTATLTFTSEAPVNMTYEIFGQELLTNEEVNNSAVRASYTPSSILNQFTQLPADSIQDYLDDPDHNDIRVHFDALDMIIDQNNDNAFVIANKIRNYLQDDTLFTVGFDALLNDPPEEGKDVVEWFCERKEGSWSEFASAFNVFCRAFGVASRFVDGFNSYEISEDQDENFDYFYAIKWKNIYNWAEIYVPFSTSGAGRWVQMDILRDTFGEGGNPLTDFNLTVESEYAIYNRPNQPEQANITATLSSATRSVDGLNIRFYDETIDPDNYFAEIPTDSYGKASVYFPINDTQVAGPHIIRAEYGIIENYTYYIVDEPVCVDFINVIPDEVNVSQTIHETNLVGNITDPLMGIGVKNALLNLILFNKGTNTIVPNAFFPQVIFTDENGEFDETVEVQTFVQSGEYEIRVDFNGTWIIRGQPYIYTNINDSSDRLEFNVTKEITKSLWFYIENFESFDYNNPIIPRYTTIELKALVLDETGAPSAGDLVYFYDYTNNSKEIGNNLTNTNGIATINYYVDLNALAGPNLLFAKLGSLENYSYFILDAPIDVNLDICPQPQVINSTTPIGRNFIIHGYLNDSNNHNPIKYSEISVHLFDGATDVSYYLILESGSLQLDETGEIFLNYRISSATPSKNYTLQVWFNGTFLYSFPNNIHNQHNFFLSWISSFSDAANGFYELKVIDPTNISILLYVEGNPTTSFYYDGYKPARYNRGDEAHFQIAVYQSGSPVSSGTLTLRDVYTNQILAIYNGDLGFVQLNISTQLLHAGLHQIEVQYGTFETLNTTYIIVNETITIDSNINPYPLKVIRNVEGFFVFGNLYDSGNYSRGLRVNIRLLNETNHDVSNYLGFEPGYQQSMTIWSDGTGYYEFRIAFIDPDCPKGRYFIRIDFNGTIDAPGIFLSDYMIHVSGMPIELNITAGTYITQIHYYTDNEDLAPDYWINGDTLHVLGDLFWDNSSVMTGYIVNVTVQLLDGTVIAFNDTAITDSFGGFHALIPIDTTWPDLRSETQIVVYFDPIYYNLEYIEGCSLKYI
jgi:hypothetical protein